MQIICGSVAFIGGALISLLNYYISRTAMKKRRNQYASFTVLRQLFNVGWLLACYMVGEKTAISTFALLIGAALGITLPSIYFTYKLLKQNQKGEQNTSSEKEGNTNG